jgi:hypothetical protein
MYTGLAAAYLGLALLFDSWWPLALWPLVLVAVRQLVIRPEEHYLTERFGQASTDYSPACAATSITLATRSVPSCWRSARTRRHHCGAPSHNALSTAPSGSVRPNTS